MACETGIKEMMTPELVPHHSGEIDSMLNLIQEIHFITWGCPHWGIPFHMDTVSGKSRTPGNLPYSLGLNRH